MITKSKFKSPAFEAIHSAATGLFSIDAIPQETVRDFDQACIDSEDGLQPVKITHTAEGFCRNSIRKC